MAPYPPPLPPADRDDRTPQAGAHARDHNELAAALAQVLDVLGLDPADGTPGRLSEQGLAELLSAYAAGADVAELAAAIDENVAALRVVDEGRLSVTTRVLPPAGFTLNGLDIPNIYRLGGGRFLADLDVTALRPPAGATYYVHPDALSTESGLTPATATRLDTALGKADVGTIIFAPGEYYRTHTSAITGKSVNYLAAAPGVRVTGWNNPGSTTWTLHAGAIYRTSRSATTGVVDVTNRTEWGDYTAYIKKADASSITGPGQWAIVGSDVYVWPIGNTNLTISANRYQLRLAVTAQTGVNITGGTSYLRGIDFEGFSTTSGLVVAGTGLAIAEDCTFRYGMGTNGVNVNSGRGAILIRCEASSNELDGFNYHGTGASLPDFIEIDCRGHHNGLADPGTNNASTAHERVRGVRVGGVYDVSGGPVVADVNSSRTWNLGCEAGATTAGGLAGASWRADATGFEADPAQMWLDECVSHGAPCALRATGAGATIHTHAHRRSNAAVTYATDDGAVVYYDPA